MEAYVTAKHPGLDFFFSFSPKWIVFQCCYDSFLFTSCFISFCHLKRHNDVCGFSWGEGSRNCGEPSVRCSSTASFIRWASEKQLIIWIFERVKKTLPVKSLDFVFCFFLDGLNAEDNFRVWVTILHVTSLYTYSTQEYTNNKQLKQTWFIIKQLE